ncbi:hypothetical protein AVEN_25094-1 [Araneus ventricosus]|uniref:Uncharacterized protein n=1 Tax=Araneus ventricosus TaxID=182803 RepID=A0A4Y2JGD2_ARAVE|nr:hypothetical protein AVEN_25094-1 [Araneus ventricosus]
MIPDLRCSTVYFNLGMTGVDIRSSLNAPKESRSCEESSQSETDAKSRKRKLELKSSKKAKRMKREPELNTAGGSLSYDEENTSESSSSSQEAPEEVLVSKEQFQKVEECESVRKSVRKLSKKARKLLNAFKSKQDIENNQQEENNVVEKNSTEDESLENQSQEGSPNSTEESNSMTEKELTSRKRKKEHKSCKKAKKRRLEEAEISTSVEKNSSHSESDDEEKIFSEECTTKSVKTEKQSRKESKKHKNKILNLKSCLKSLSNNKYSFKEKRKVSFCENISYKVIENVLNNFDSDVVLETNEQLLSCSDEDCTDSEVPNEVENIGMNDVDDSNSSGKSSNGDVQCGSEDVPCREDSDMVEDNTVPECFKLPKCSSTNYDGWLETQRIAARMKVYKNMVKKMKKHPILRKTNLLEIKGYGNWGL